MINLKSKSKLVLFITLILSIIGLIFLRLYTSKSSSPINSPSPQTPTPPPSLPILSPPSFFINSAYHPLPYQVSPPSNQLSPSPFPSTLPTYQLISNLISDQASAIASNLGFTSPPVNQKPYLSWIREGYLLTINTTKTSISYRQPLPSNLDLSSPDTVKAYVQDLIAKLTLNSLLWTSPQINTSFFSSEKNAENLKPASPQSANVLKIYLTPTLNQYPVTSTATFGLAEVTISQPHQVVSVSLPHATSRITPANSYPLVNSANFSPLLLSQWGKIISLNPNSLSYNPPSNSSPQSASINTTNLAYFIDPTQSTQTIQPIFVFTGTTQLQDLSSTPFTAFMPAIDPNYLLAPSP